MEGILPEERRRRILALVRDHGRIEVSSLAMDLAVAQETVRRDLKLLEDHGLVRRTHGGAYPVESTGFESDLRHRSNAWVGEKRRIAQAAVEQLDDAESVYIDEGFTPQIIAEQLLHVERPLTVVTSSLASATVLAERPDTTVLLLGGRVRARTLGTVDHWATAMLAGLVIDLAFLGANGISRDRGLTTPDPAVAAVKAQVVAVSRRRVFVGVRAKFGVTSFCHFADVGAFEALVTDASLPASEAHRYAALGPQVIRA